MGRAVGLLDGLGDGVDTFDRDIAVRTAGHQAEAGHHDNEQSEGRKGRSWGTDAGDSVHDALNNVGALLNFKRCAKNSPFATR